MPEWFVAKVKPKQEQKVQAYLAHYGVDVRCHRMNVLRSGKLDAEQVFPGYVFIHAAPRTPEWPVIRWAPGLQYLLPHQDDPHPVSDRLVKELEERVARWNAGGWTKAFQPGDQVSVDAGPLKGLDAVFQRYLPSQRRCAVLISLLGRPQEVSVDIGVLRTQPVAASLLAPENAPMAVSSAPRA